MTAQSFDHERLDVYRLSIDYVARSFEASQSLAGLHRHARDQWLCAAQAIPRNIADSSADYDAAIDYDYEHRFAEHEHDTETENTPEQDRDRGQPCG
jgi:hypothetical protein